MLLCISGWNLSLTRVVDQCYAYDNAPNPALYRRLFTREATLLPDTSKTLLDGLTSVLTRWSANHAGDASTLYWVLRLQLAETGLSGESSAAVRQSVPETMATRVKQAFEAAEHYFNDVRYAALEPVTQVWGTVVNALRVASNSSRATDGQKRVFSYSVDELVAFFVSAREMMAVADELYSTFRAMPAPECQALAALLNIHVDAQIDGHSIGRIVRLIDHEGPLSDEEHDDLASISNTGFVNATFRGLRAHA